MQLKLTEQMNKVLEIAEKEREDSFSPCILPGHLLLGCLNDGSFPVWEAKQKSGIDPSFVRKSLIPHEETMPYEFCQSFNLPVCPSTKLVLRQAVNYMKNYNQIFLNEGHVLKALIKTGQIEGLLTRDQASSLLNIATSSRDMILSLEGYASTGGKYKYIKMLSNQDGEKLIRFIHEEFGSRWMESIQEAIALQKSSIYVAFDQDGEEIVGFAAFDIQKPGFFGPMGVGKNKRAEGIGESLLHFCLEEMSKMGYKEIIIDQAGPIEFYEKTCNAKVIPANDF
ncbi:GNAT family N-acetyltransferase [Bacillus sp. ISL-35]|uniref:GNAT family N-acetyltransferase n=1 Tax=Bacillus sp. ISL-35 TaxID=2819122 RepID=UPI001BE9D887|nr:GNAT family N-acetyltransferase [Bacillus sp. ISL-35]MBT2680960.1 GNAT family N-acetyltransferase [Bacillus sp. ISL-35]MBT2705279.1 GNAT family N-acetyltransferase [Chryseobacterium sp. ISL-80]